MPSFRSSISYACLPSSSCQTFKTHLLHLLPKTSLHAIIPISFYFIMALIIRLTFILSLFLFSLLFHRSFLFNSNTHYQLHPNRKILATPPTPFDFTPFLHNHHHYHHHRRHRHRTHLPDPNQPQIDPRYGVDKRLVPTGPNPLHH
ncbi:hypothetical protein V8G54_017413 [Vigna mungo]|uniref:Uncharacterized protein n=1 Tax=Vigna mungo TaxID=3915 RepID=A0AAQ3NPQ9_VIGMU